MIPEETQLDFTEILEVTKGRTISINSYRNGPQNSLTLGLK